MESKINNSKKLQSNHFILTYHCDELHDWRATLQRGYDTGHYDCVAGQLEAGKKDGKIHIQAYILAKQRTLGSKVLKDFPEGTWFKAPKKFQSDKANTGARMYEYATKEDTRVNGPLCLGEPPARVNNSDNGRDGKNKQVKRSGEATQLAAAGDFKTLMEEYPDLYLKHYTNLKRIHLDHKRDTISVEPFQFKLKQWQERVMDYLSTPDARKVLWVHGEQGNEGKSTFAKWLSARGNTFYCAGGSGAELLFQIKDTDTTLIYDLPKSYDHTFMSYTTLELFKTGHWRSSKYEGNYVSRKTDGSVIIFSNRLPDVTKLSADRWIIISIDKDGDDYINIDYNELRFNTLENYKV